MRIGLTYDLRDRYLELGFTAEEAAEFDYPETIDAIQEALECHGWQVDRVGNLEDLAGRLLRGDRWDLVFNMAEGMHGIGREAQIPALLDAWRIPYTFSDALTCALTLHKVMAKRVLRDHGLPTPPFAIVAEQADIGKIDLPFPLMVKPLQEGNSKGVSPESKVDSPAALEARCRHVITRFAQPALVETFLSGREFTVGILGTGPDARPVGVLEKLLGDEPVYFKYATGFPGVLVDDPEARLAGRLALAAWNALGCRDGGRIDIRSDAMGNPYILEANALPGLRPHNSDLPVMCELAGIPFRELIGRIVRSALARNQAPVSWLPEIGQVD